MKERLSRFLNESRQRTARFMTGRNGNDALNRFLLVCDLVLLLLSSLLRGPFFLLALALLVYIIIAGLSIETTM